MPLVIAVVIFTTMWTWLQGRARRRRQREGRHPAHRGHCSAASAPAACIARRARRSISRRFSGNAPGCLLHNLKHNEVLHEHVVLLTIEVPDEPYVAAGQRAEVSHLGKGVHRVVLHYGFMEQPDVPRDLAPLADKGVPFDPMRTSYFIGRNSYRRRQPGRCCRAGSRSCSWRWPASPSSAADFFGLPANRVGRAGQPHRDLTNHWRNDFPVIPSVARDL